ncbi:MAG: sugar kinase [Planctomycetes bacterium]|nr:sugar kinase [Planctomycetota bacterium]
MSQVITLGEAMIRLAPPHYRRLEQTDTLDVEIGGAELNTAVGLVRLGRSASWVSRLTSNALGRVLANRAREAGVDTDDILWTDQDRVGVYFVEFGAAPRPSSIIYDRANSAMAMLQPGMLDWKKIFAGASWLYVTGITAALSPSSSEATLEALRAAKEAGLTTCLDPNYRAKLWSVDEAAEWLNQAIKYIDVLITNPEDINRFFHIPNADNEKAMAAAVEKFKLKAIAMTLRQVHSVWKNGWTAIAYEKGKLFTTQNYEVEIVDRLGAGDAFASGLIHGLIDGDLQKGLDYGGALSALKHTIPGDLPWVTKDEVEGLLKGGGLRISR